MNEETIATEPVAEETPKVKDTVKKELSEEEKEILGAKKSDKEVKEEPKEESAKEAGEETEKDMIGDIFGLNKKDKEEVKEEPEKTKLTEDERAEYMKLKAEVETAKEKEAFSKVFADFTEDEIGVIKSTVEAIISSDRYDALVNAGLSPEERALVVLSLAEKRHSKKLNEMRTKGASEVIENKLKEEKNKEIIKEVAKVDSNAAPKGDSKAERNKELRNRARAGDSNALHEWVLGDDMEQLKKLQNQT